MILDNTFNRYAYLNTKKTFGIISVGDNTIRPMTEHPVEGICTYALPQGYDYLLTYNKTSGFFKRLTFGSTMLYNVDTTSIPSFDFIMGKPNSELRYSSKASYGPRYDLFDTAVKRREEYVKLDDTNIDLLGGTILVKSSLPIGYDGFYISSMAIIACNNCHPTYMGHLTGGINGSDSLYRVNDQRLIEKLGVSATSKWYSQCTIRKYGTTTISGAKYDLYLVASRGYPYKYVQWSSYQSTYISDPLYFLKLDDSTDTGRAVIYDEWIELNTNKLMDYETRTLSSAYGITNFACHY